MNTAVLIATHERRGITTTNIQLLKQQSFEPTIVIICSDPKEGEYYARLTPHVLVAPNAPLGNKWQTGVNYIRNFLNVSHLVITGSDDILSVGFIRKYCTGTWFIGLQKWYIWDDKIGVLHLLDYLAHQCLGGGRVYNRAMLESYDWKIFDKTSRRLLDDQGWECTNPIRRKIVEDEGCILAVKGNWPVMNPVDVRHRNVRVVEQWTGAEAEKIMLEKFNFKL